MSRYLEIDSGVAPEGPAASDAPLDDIGAVVGESPSTHASPPRGVQ